MVRIEVGENGTPQLRIFLLKYPATDANLSLYKARLSANAAGT
jgi:hypothetical protein